MIGITMIYQTAVDTHCDNVLQGTGGINSGFPWQLIPVLNTKSPFNS
jgi:hypothetical protein